MSFFSLFSTPAAPSPVAAPSAGGGVAEAVRAGAERSGVDFAFLLRTAKRESALDPNARAETSSATGLFQFIDQTWLATVKADGAKHGLERYADAITVGSNGRLTVADPALKVEILALRRDPQTSAALAGELAQRNGATLAEALGRPASEGELYLAHVRGARGAVSLIRKAAATPDDKAAASFPEEAAANRGLFYARGGRARSLSELRAVLTDGFATTSPTAVAAASASAAASARAAGDPAAGGAWLSFFGGAAAKPATATAAARPLDGLFATEGARGPVSRQVARLWTPRDGAATPTRVAYFPTDTGAAAAPAAESADAPASEAAQPAAAAAPAGRKPRARVPGKPLDLLALMKPVAT